jgi:6-phosphogluconate dehydrogenase (decarboxylating)
MALLQIVCCCGASGCVGEGRELTASERGESHYADQLLSATRQQFGGHAELPTVHA